MTSPYDFGFRHIQTAKIVDGWWCLDCGAEWSRVRASGSYLPSVTVEGEEEKCRHPRLSRPLQAVYAAEA